MIRLRKFMVDTIPFTGSIEADLEQLATGGAAYTIPDAGDILLPENLINYNIHMLAEIEKKVYRRLSIWLGEQLPVVDFPLSVAFSETVGFEGIKQAKVLLPDIPSSLAGKVHFPFNLAIGSFKDVQVCVLLEHDSLVEIELVAADGASASVIRSVTAADGWVELKLPIPDVMKTKVASDIRVGVVSGTLDSLLQLGRISLGYDFNELPAPVVR